MLITAATATTRMTGPLRLHCGPVGNHLGRLVVDGGRSGTGHFGPTGPTTFLDISVLSATTRSTYMPSSVTAERTQPVFKKDQSLTGEDKQPSTVRIRACSIRRPLR
jgi:hypothetical protein